MGKEFEIMKSHWLGRELTMEVVVGAFMVVVFLGLGYFTIILTRENWFVPKYTMQVRFTDVMGLTVGDDVVVRGMPVGKVKRLSLENEPASRVLVTLTLDQSIPVRKGYKITVASTSMLGGRDLAIDQGPEASPLIPNGIVLDGVQPYDLMADAAQMVNSIKTSLIDGGVITNMQSAVAQLNEMISRVNQGKGVLGKLLSEDDTLYNNLSASVTSLKNISGGIERGEGSIGKLVKDDTVYNDLSATAASLKNISGSIERGEGVLGKLVKDDTLYKKLESTVDEARATIDDYRETAPIVTFTSVFFGAL
jgi:phospholipid/cholesterol/gamma-HCH transport system substrate-binding protein